MKKIILVLVLISLFPVSILFAQRQSQSQSGPSEYYYINIPIEKVFTTKLGYIVAYRRGHSLVHAYIPQTWFTGAASKAEVINLGPGREWPSMTVFYHNGEFSHLRLKLRRERNHETWGFIRPSPEIDAQFEGVEEIRLLF